MPGDPIDHFLAFYPPSIVRQTHRLRALVTRAVPQALERIRRGWRLIGYDLPITRHGTYFAWVWPEFEHVHVGWQVGTLMNDPNELLRGAHLKLKKVRSPSNQASGFPRRSWWISPVRRRAWRPCRAASARCCPSCATQPRMRKSDR